MLRVVCVLMLPLASALFFGGGGGGGCGCQPACPPPPPPPVCAPPPSCPPPSPCGGGYRMHAAKTRTAEPIALGTQNAFAMPSTASPAFHDLMNWNMMFPQYALATQTAAPVTAPQQADELEMRAAALGIPMSSSSQPNPNEQIARLEALGGRSGEGAQPSTADYMEDTDLISGLRREQKMREIRRAPQVAASTEAPVQTTTLSSETGKISQAAEDPAETPKCNSQVLKRLMQENMTENSSESKRRVNEAAEAKFGGSVDVVCSRGHFSYVFSSNLYCETTKGLITCIAFRQSTN